MKKRRKGQSSLEMMLSFTALLLISLLILNAIPKSEINQRNEALELIKKKDSDRSAFALGYLVGDSVKFENEIECNSSAENLEIFGIKIDKITCSYSSASRWFLK